MYCPRCSQEQGSEAVSFCTRCGLQLGAIKDLLAAGGTPSGKQIVSRSRHWLPSRRSLRFGVKLMFFSLMLSPIFLALSFAFDSPFPLCPPAVLFLAGLTCTLYSWIFGEDLIPSRHKATATLSGVILESSTLPSPSPQSLGPQGELRAMPVHTAEMIHPPSVTERTTNLLAKNY